MLIIPYSLIQSNLARSYFEIIQPYLAQTLDWMWNLNNELITKIFRWLI